MGMSMEKRLLLVLSGGIVKLLGIDMKPGVFGCF
jgi:hypothetical protein